MRYDLFRVWPSCILGCFIIGFFVNYFWLFCGIWILIGMISYNMNGKAHFMETLKINFFLVGSNKYYISFSFIIFFIHKLIQNIKLFHTFNLQLLKKNSKGE